MIINSQCFHVFHFLHYLESKDLRDFHLTLNLVNSVSRFCLSLAPSFSPPRESRMDSPLLNFVRERSLHPIPLFSSDRGLDRTKGTETGYEGNQRAWRKEREREGERIHQQEPPRGVGVVCHWQTFIPQLRSEQSFAVRYAQPRFSFSFFFPFFVSREQRRQ